MRSLLFAIAAAWFAYHALTFTVAAATPDATVIGDAVQNGVRTICAGLAVTSLAGIGWGRIARALDAVPIGIPPKPPRSEW
jgi:hypothetical protein